MWDPWGELRPQRCATCHSRPCCGLVLEAEVELGIAALGIAFPATCDPRTSAAHRPESLGWLRCFAHTNLHEPLPRVEKIFHQIEPFFQNPDANATLKTRPQINRSQDCWQPPGGKETERSLPELTSHATDIMFLRGNYCKRGSMHGVSEGNANPVALLDIPRPRTNLMCCGCARRGKKQRNKAKKKHFGALPRSRSNQVLWLPVLSRAKGVGTRTNPQYVGLLDGLYEHLIASCVFPCQPYQFM